VSFWKVKLHALTLWLSIKYNFVYMKQLSTLLLIVCLSFRVFGQQETMPKECTNPPAGIQVGGAFTVSPEFACLDFTDNTAKISVYNPLSPSGGQLSNLGYIFNFKDGDSLNFKAPTSTTVSKSGIYWIMQGGSEKGQTYITCKAVEVIQTERPDVNVSFSCDRKTVSVNFLNTAKNQKHGKYRILWGDGIQEIISRPSFPFDKTHSYLNSPPALPQIVAIYTRGGSNGFDVCQSEPYDFSFEPVYKPIVNKVQNLNDGKRVRISMEGGNDNKAHLIQQKISDKWLNTGYRISQKKGELSSEVEFDVIQSSGENCFRLQAVDSLCNDGITSNEICKLSLETSSLSSKYVELKWNALDTTNLQRYIISYSELDGKNANTTASQNRANSFNFEIPDCSKKYNIEVIGEYRNLTNRIISVSQKIIIDPNCILSTSKEADRFNIYPNPSEDFVQLSSIFQLKTAEIVDLQGKVIENQSIENGQVSVKHLPKGKYILRLYGNDKKLISSKTIIKM
jgi:phosphoribosylformylglycinamidine (FGAM) synthase PurS component